MSDTTNKRPAPRREPEPWGIWIGVAVTLLVLVASIAIGGLAGLTVVGVVASLAVLAIMVRVAMG